MVMGRSANDRAFYDNLSRLTVGSVESLVRSARSSGEEASDGRAVRASLSRSIRTPRGSVVETTALLLGRPLLVVFVGFPWIVGLIAIGWFI